MTETDTTLEKEYSTSTHLSFNLMQVMLAASYGMVATHLFWFYETEVLLPVLYIGIALLFYAVWDAFNDPLIGYLSDKPNRFTKRYGRRFPFIIKSIARIFLVVSNFTYPRSELYRCKLGKGFISRKIPF